VTETLTLLAFDTLSRTNSLYACSPVCMLRNTAEYGRKKRNSFDFSRWSVKLGRIRQCNSSLLWQLRLLSMAFFFQPSSGVYGRAENTAEYGANVTVALVWYLNVTVFYILIQQVHEFKQYKHTYRLVWNVISPNPAAVKEDLWNETLIFIWIG
jgi:hypothetical protein